MAKKTKAEQLRIRNETYKQPDPSGERCCERDGKGIPPMSSEDKKRGAEYVLESFLLEDEIDASTLQRYLQRYPEFATELTDLAREITCISDYPNYATSEGDDVRIAQAWRMHADTAPSAKVDPLEPIEEPSAKGGA